MAEQLGVDAKKFGITGRNSYDDEDEDDDLGFTPSSKLSDEERFRDAQPLRIVCRECSAPNHIRAALRCVLPGSVPEGGFDFRGMETDSLAYAKAEAELNRGASASFASASSVAPSLCCANCNARFSPAVVQNCLRLSAKAAVSRYYDHWMVSDDHTLSSRTKQQSVMGRLMMIVSDATGGNNVVSMRPEYPASALYTQLKYFETMFDLKRVKRKVEGENGKRSAANARAAGAVGGASSSAPLPLLDANVVSEKGEDAAQLTKIKALAVSIVEKSEYSWIGTDIWRTAFGGAKNNNNSKNKKNGGKAAATSMGMRGGRTRVYA